MQINLIDLYDIKTDILKLLENELYKNPDNDTTYIKNKIINLKQKMFNNELIFNPVMQNDILDSSIFNQNNEYLYIDLLTVFQCINDIDKIITRHISLNQEVINEIRINIRKAYDIIEALENTIGQKSNPVHVVHTFDNLKYIENNNKYYKERYDEIIPKHARAYYDKNIHSITLSKLMEENQCIDNNGTSFVDISIKKQIGKNFIKLKNKNTSINKAIDLSEETFWQENILADEPLQVTFSKDKPSKVTNSSDYYYGASFGAICEIALNFEYKCSKNEIYLNPYCKYPLEIIAIRYKESDDTNEEVKEIISPDMKNKEYKNIFINKPISFKFKTIQCKHIYILFRQIHYTRNVINYSVDDVFRNELWYTIINQNIVKPLKEEQILFKPIYKDICTKNNVYIYLKNLLNSNKNFDIGEMIFDYKNRNRKTIKYEYIYGFYNIKCLYNKYDYSGIYVFKEIQNLNNIRGMAITTEEKHIKAPDNKIYTDIEYYITYKQNPTYEDWIPILPKNISKIECELLQIENNICKLRFPAIKIFDLCMDNKFKLIQGYDYFVHKDKNDNIYAVEIPNFDFTSKYTISYEPIYNSHYIDFADIENNLSNNNEVIQCNNKDYYKLSSPAYINCLTTKPQTNLVIINTKTGEVLNQKNNKILCITNNICPSESYKNFSKDSKIQYYINNNYIYINKKLNNNYVLEISYNYSISNIRLKMILRRNNDQYQYITPIVNKINYEFYPML